jgi:glycosyltransferase involved in cell wall biosynthesis/SAM-dependent methyltransferase
VGKAPGANIVGFFRAEFGQGEVARRLAQGLNHAGLPHTTITYENVPHRQEHAFEEQVEEAAFDTNILALNAEHLLTFASGLGAELLADRYSAGVWFWETSRFPAYLQPAFKLVDEIWVASKFVASAIASETAVPVLTFPMPVEVPAETTVTRRDIGLDDERFAYVFVFDFYSTVQRKNPDGLIEAFKRAFEPGDGAFLMVKSINGDRFPEELKALHEAAANRPDIVVRDGFVSAEQVRAYAALGDCAVSLHRSEGFGLTLAEAMAHGKPAIATGYSGNLQFMTDENSFLVPYRPATLERDVGPYPAGSVWAEPDLDEAAGLMRRVKDDADEARRRGELGRETIREEHSVLKTAAFLSERLEEISTLTPRRRVQTPAKVAAEYLARGPRVPWDAPSRLGPLGALYRKLLRRLLRPYTMRHQEFEHSVVDALHELEIVRMQQETRAERIESSLRSLETTLQSLTRRLERATETVEELYATPYTAEREMFVIQTETGEALGFDRETAEASASAYVGFEDVFRGSEDRIRDLQRPYLDVIGERRPVLDAGSGRGEFLDLLAGAGIPATGIDLDRGMVERSRAKGHDVELGDAVSFLAAGDEPMYGAIFASHVIEHLVYEELVRFFELARKRLLHDGLLIVETVNPHSISAFKTFWTDPTHQAPLFPEVTLAVARTAGFDSARIMFPGGTGDLDDDRRRRTEYALIARKA